MPEAGESYGTTSLLEIDGLDVQIKKPGSERSDLTEVNKCVRGKARI